MVSVEALKVGVVVEFPNEAVFMECVEVERSADAYTVLQETNLPVTWTIHPIYGHGLCAIFDIGCLETGCVCKSRYWNFYVMRNDLSWVRSPVGFDGGSSCREHYCAWDGDVLGFTFDSVGGKPKEIIFEDICPIADAESGDVKIDKPDIIGNVVGFPKKNAGFISAILIIFLLVAYFVHKPWEYI